MTAGDAAVEFMSRVVPWPELDGPGYVNLHWLRPMLRDPSKLAWSGRATRGPRELIESSQWALGITTIRDQYFCLSLQRQVKIKNNKISPERNQKNAMCLRSLWIDVDVDTSNKAGKGYPTTNDALDAVIAFIAAKQLPPPSSLVASGSGGVHVYWFGTKDLTPEQWQPLAEALKHAILEYGLKCDAGCTIDSARVLRVPLSRNYKRSPPTDVRILTLQDRANDYDLETVFAHLVAAAPVPTKAIASLTPANSYFDPALFPPRAPITESLAEGIEKFDREQPLQALPVMKACPFLRDALLTGGATYGQPLWNLATLCATFIEDGDQLAHRMGNQHPGYTAESTDALYERKSRERKEKGLGWPSCKTIRDNGCAACATCPHFSKGKSPLHLTSPVLPPGASPLLPGITATVTPQLAAANLSLPDFHTVDEDGHICRQVITEQSNGPPITVPVKLLESKLSRPWIQADPKWFLNFTATTDLGRLRDIQIPYEEVTGETAKAFLARGVPYVADNKRWLEGFVVSWIAKLQREQQAVGQHPLGWYEDDHGKKMGFIYGGTIFMQGGVERPSGIKDPNVRKVYTPTGDPAIWWQALQMILGEGRPELEVLLATGFAGPLMRAVGAEQTVLSAWGETGARKSSAIKVAQAIWAHHKQARESAQTTSKSAVERLGYIRNLTLYWDEVKDAKAQKNTYDVCFGQDGIGGGKLYRDSTQREKAEWQTLLVIAANISFVDYILKQNDRHAGGLVRCFEFAVEKPPQGAQGQIDTLSADRLLQELEHNYGHMGVDYAKLLASDPDAVDKLVKDVYDDFNSRIVARIDERRWIGACSAIIAGAILANQLNVGFNVTKIRDFLISAFGANRERRLAENLDDEGLKYKAQDTLYQFLRDKHPNSVWTDWSNEKPGRKKPVLLIHSPNTQNPRPVHVHWSTKDRVLRIERSAWEAYLKEKEVQSRNIDVELKNQLGMTRPRMQLCIGTSWRCGPFPVMRFDVPVNTPLDDLMNSWQVPTEDEAAQPVFQPAPNAPAAMQATIATALGIPQASLDANAKDQATAAKASGNG